MSPKVTNFTEIMLSFKQPYLLKSLINLLLAGVDMSMALIPEVQ